MAETMDRSTRDPVWPPLPLEAWRETCDTLHMMTQVVGKIRLALATPINHWWHVPLYVTAHGLTTSPMPYRDRLVEIEFDFLRHELRIARDDSAVRTIALSPRPVAEFYRDVMTCLAELAIDVHVWTMPVEVENPIPFDRDTTHRSYDAQAVTRFWRVLEQATRVMTEFRSRFLGKVSPVHFFWGSFDLAVTRFSGRKAPPHPGAALLPQSVTQEAYSHEVSSAGFWPGGGALPEPIFYSYAYPEPQGFRDAPVAPKAASYNTDVGEFVLPYQAVRAADSPDQMLLDFFQSTYTAAADLARWDRAELERRA